jgi:CBS domain-containing protein
VSTVSWILQRKPSQSVWSITPHTSIADAVKLLAEKNIGALLVLEEQQVVGIISERDVVRALFVGERVTPQTPVGEIMTRKVLYVRPEQTIDECMALMTDKRLRHLPVLEHDQLIGIISIGDVVKYSIDDREFMLEQLVNYITDRRS